ncbi:MAG TPA: SIMPL domain-containing protein [Thermoanaerobaculia bacterium]
MKKITAALALAIALTTFPLAAHEEAATPVVPILSVQANGEARVAPDEATVRLGVLAQAPTARAAMDEANRSANAILDAIRKLGVKAEDIQTSELNLNPLYANEPEMRGGEPRISGYQATNVVSVRLEKLDQVGPVVDAGLAAGANRLDGVIFGLRNDEAARSTALTRAAEAARIKAETLARALRVRLVEIVEVVEGGVSVFTPMYKGARMAMETSMAADTPVSAGQVGIDANVTLRYRIEPCPAQGCP